MMMMNKLILLALSAAGTLASSHSDAMLLERQLVPIPCDEQGRKDCGVGCIPLSWTCCPSGAGGCPATAYCNLGSNGEYNCCPRGQICGGPGGASTDRFTNTVTLPGETSTIEPPTVTLEPTTESVPEPEPTEPAEPTEPVEPTEPTVPAEPTEPTVPVEPTEPAEPTYEPPSTSSSVVVVPEPTTYTTTVETTGLPSATPVPLPTPIGNDTTTTTSTASVPVVNAGAANAYYSATNNLFFGGLMAGVAAFLI